MGGIIISSKQFECQRFVYKIHSARLRKAKWNLTLSLLDARKNDEVISLASSQVLRWIDEINGIDDADVQAREIQRQIRLIRGQPHSPANAAAVKRLYSDLDKLQFKPDYMCLVIDRNSDYIRACNGFMINGIQYERLLGTPGGIKMSTIVFVSSRVASEIKRRIENDRNPDNTFIPAKLEAYKALTCSASTPVSPPRKVLVVRDVEMSFKDNVIDLSNDGNGEPTVSEPHMADITITASDGCGMILPSFAERWSRDLRLQYNAGGFCIRMAWTKGMVYAFPFVEYARDVAGKYIVQDVWGNDVDIRDVDLVLPVSMVKLWDSYSSCEEWLGASDRNGYSFAVTKVCAEKLESERTLNYQFIQVFNLNSDDIDELIEPTVSEIRDAMCGDWAKTVLYLKGMGLNENNVLRLDNDWQKALMIEPGLMNDPYVAANIHRMIKKRIDEAKVGVLTVHGNYSTASGDLYALCQSVFGQQVTGLLRAGEIYNHYWAETDSDEVLAFRAPMSCAENVKRMKVSRTDDVLHWYRYMTACTVLNAHDSTMCALNGADFDGDLVMLTDNDVLLRRHEVLPTLMCAQRKGSKKIPTEEDFVQSNIASFGNEVGAITNKGTSMYEVRAKYPQQSEEYERLTYRIRCTQAYQQDSIDKAKGVVSAPMPRSWYDRHAISREVSEDEQHIYRSVVADRKPYFMRYIYPALSKQYNTYIKAANKNALREFDMTIPDMLERTASSLTEQQLAFIQKYWRYMPVGMSNCVMNTICRKIETQFRLLAAENSKRMFDYKMLKSGSDYSSAHLSAIKQIMNEYNKKVQAYAVEANCARPDEDEKRASLASLDRWFMEKCIQTCPDSEELCDIVLDLCYSREKTKQFAWKMCGDIIVRNLARRKRSISFPQLDERGNIKWKSEKFSIASAMLDVIE